ncbi:formin-like protein 18 [Tanacetum coccineum]
MPIDKTWTRPNLNRNTNEFKAGLNTFIEMCKAHLNERNKCFCPCRRCENGTTHELSVIKKYIRDHGFSMYYDVWEYHGENFIIALLVLNKTNDMINGFFDIVPWLRGPHGALIEKGTTASFKGLWKGRKSNFKKHEFVLRDGYKEPIKIRDFPPTDVKIDEWQKLCDHFTSEKHLKRSRSSKFNEETNEFPDLIDHFCAKHMKGGK